MAGKRWVLGFRDEEEVGSGQWAVGRRRREA